MYDKLFDSTKIAIDCMKHLIHNDCPRIYEEYCTWTIREKLRRLFLESIDHAYFTFHETINFQTIDVFNLSRIYQCKMETIDAAARPFYRRML